MEHERVIVRFAGIRVVCFVMYCTAAETLRLVHSTRRSSIQHHGCTQRRTSHHGSAVTFFGDFGAVIQPSVMIYLLTYFRLVSARILGRRGNPALYWKNGNQGPLLY